MNFMLSWNVLVGIVGAPSPAVRHPGFEDEDAAFRAFMAKLFRDGESE